VSLLERYQRALSFWQIVRQMLAIRARELAAAAKVKLKERARWAWRHRTKSAGGLTMSLGAAKTYALTHPAIHLWGEGYLLLACGGLITAIGVYNSLALFFGWEDEP
jgi:hypothetical protein